MTGAKTSIRTLALFAALAAAPGAPIASAQDASQAKSQPKSQPKSAASFTLDQYLGEVEGKHEGLKAARESSQAAGLYVREARAALAPALVGSAKYMEDRAPQMPLAMQYDVTKSDSIMIGVQQQTSYGLGAKLYYQWDESEIDGLHGFAGFSLPLSNVPRYYQGRPTIELTMPLWRNWLGEETRGGVDAKEAQTKADRAASEYNAQQIRLQAETAYWRLALAREAVRVSAESLDRSEKIDQWTRRRSNLQLADRSDYLQSQASVKSHRVDLERRRDEERAATRAFNSLRGSESLEAPETLQAFSMEVAANMKAPARAHERGDVLVAREQANAAVASAKFARQQDLPTVELFGAYAFNGLSFNSGEAFQNSWQTDRPTQSIGVRVNAPLDLGALSDARRGREILASAAELNFHRKRFEQEREWDDLAQKFQEARERLSLFEELEKIQREKATNERQRQLRGRSTMRDVLSFENDYQDAQLQKIQTLSELNQLNAQMKLFGVAYESR